MIVVEQAWFERILNTPLHVYEMPSDPFALHDTSAGYYIAREPVQPRTVRTIRDLTGEILDRGCEVRYVPNLWPIYDGVTASTLDFSIIRMRNAQPRP